MMDKDTSLRIGLAEEDMDLLVEECREKLNEIEHDLNTLVERGEPMTSEFVRGLFRSVHRVQGTADVLGSGALRRLSFTAEKAVAAVRDSKIEPTLATTELLLGAVQRLRQIFAHDDPSAEVECGSETDDLSRMLEGGSDPYADGAHREEDLCSTPPGVRPSEGTPSTRPLKVLVVEDDFTSRVMLGGLLRPYGHCDVAVNGKEAVDAFRAARDSSWPYDLICMDVRMPGMDGTEAVQQIRAIEEASGVYSTSGVKIFMTTAISDLKTVSSSYRALCDAYLFKPIDGGQLQQHLLSFGLIQGTARGGRR